MKIEFNLSRATPDKLQDAWHYAMMLVDRQESMFDGDRHYPNGIRGQVLAYEEMLNALDSMAEDNETWQLLESDLWEPPMFEHMVSNSKLALVAINSSAARLNVDARTGKYL